MNLSFFKKLKISIYKTFLMFMICISMAADPMIQEEIKKMLERLNEVNIEQMEQTEEAEEEEEDESNAKP